MPVPTLTWQEGVALGTLGVLLGQGKKPVPDAYDPSSVTPDTDSAFVQVARQRIVRRCLHTLLHEGGSQRTGVLREGRRAEGSLLSPSLNTDFALHFGPMTDTFVRTVLPKLPQLMGRAIDRTTWRNRGRRWAKGVLKGRTDRPGDWLFLDLVHANLPRLGIPADTEQALRGRVRMVSPLAALSALRNHVHGLHSDLIAPRSVRLVECLQPRLRRTWVTGVRTVLSGHLSPEHTITRLDEIRLVWTRWVQTLHDQGRLDLAGAVLGALLDVVGGYDGPTDLRTRIRSDLPNARTADQICHAVADLLDLVPTIREHHHTLRAAGYGDDRYDEALLVTEMIETVDVPTLDVHGAIASLRGRIG